MYFANTSGILEFDGTNWRMVQGSEDKHFIRFALNDNGRIFASASGDIGYLEGDSLGSINFISLLPQLGDEYQDFSVAYVEVVAGIVYFHTRNHLLRWSDGHFKVWKARGDFWRSFSLQNRFYIQDGGLGLLSIQDDSLSLIPHGDSFKNIRIQEILSLDEASSGKQNWLVLTYENGLYQCLENYTARINTDEHSMLSEVRIMDGLLLSDSLIAIATETKGIILVNNKIEIQKIIDKGSGLHDNGIITIYQDREHGLWVGLNQGISRIAYPSFITVLGSKIGVDGTALSFLRTQSNRLFLGTSSGLYELRDEGQIDAAFRKVTPPAITEVWDIAEYEGNIILATFSGVFEFANTNFIRISPKGLDGAYKSYQSKLDPERFFIGFANGLGSMLKSDGNWIWEGMVQGIDHEVRTMAEINHELWVGFEEVSRIDISSGVKSLKKIEHFNTSQGFKDELGVYEISSIDNKVLFGTFSGIYSFDEQKFKLVPDSTFGEQFSDGSREALSITKDNRDQVWLLAGDLVNRLSPMTDGTYKADFTSYKKIPAIDVWKIYPDKDEVVWFGTTENVFRYDDKVNKDQSVAFHTLIRKVTAMADSTVFNGTFGDLATTAQPEEYKFTLPFDRRDISFEYAATSYEGIGQSLYTYILEGYDNEWSSWTAENKKEYTSLKEGDYTFKVKAQNIYEIPGQQAAYKFTILPPWYRTWWAYILYTLALGGFIWQMVQWRSTQLRKEKEVLEREVADRTSEILEKNQQLKQQAETLSYQAEKLRETDHLKSRLFANISHEFRTPLTLIKGPVDQIADNPDSPLSQSNISMIRRNTNRLLRLVNQLLDLSKLDAGRLQLVLTEGDVFKCLRAAASSFSSLATQRNLDYQVHLPSLVLTASFDRDKLEKIIYNLLSNAFKFTPDQGTIIFSASYDQNQMTMTVTDSGHGIPSEKINHIFDRFYQVDDSQTREQEGTGIGLALTKELIVLMNGSIYVTSKPDSGSAFHITIPLKEIHTNSTSKVLANPDSSNHALSEIDLTIEQPILEPGATHRSNLVLVVEDNADMREYISQQLCEDYQVLEAVHGQEGLVQARDQIPDLIITDLMMPQMDGTELCRQIKTDKRTSHIPVIMLTAKASLDNKIEGLETGADDYLTKPFDSRELAVRVKNLIDQRQRLRELFARDVTVDPKQITVTSLDEQFLQSTLDLLEENYSNSDFGSPQMQETLNMSKTQLHRKIKALTDQAPGELLRNFRLKRAAQILAGDGENVTQVAYSVGFNNLSYFAKCFKELHGVAPSKYTGTP